MGKETKFSTCNPLINFIFFIGALVFGMLFMHPIFLASSVLFSSALFLTVKGRRAFAYFLGLIPVFIVVTLINPVFNTYGETVLFSYFGRPYTLEALYYGMAMAAMFVSVLLWFSSYNQIMTSDKFLYLFGKVIPSVSMILTMVLRFVPNYTKKAAQIGTARKCIGKSAESDSKADAVKNGTTVVSALTSWAFEGGIVTADSMKSRGYGTGKRTSFSIYSFSSIDKLVAFLMLITAAVTAFCGIRGAATATYTPSLYIREIADPYTAVGVLAYCLFLIIPTALNITEELTWRILKSRI